MPKSITEAILEEETIKNRMLQLQREIRMLNHLEDYLRCKYYQVLQYKLRLYTQLAKQLQEKG